MSMDYGVFILTRMREERDATTEAGVIDGISRTGRLVTGAALILFFAFAALSTGPEPDLKVAVTALGARILLDATVVGGLLVPAPPRVPPRYGRRAPSKFCAYQDSFMGTTSTFWPGCVASTILPLPMHMDT